ncbi:uncharacterized protein LOC112683778 [Sipha flava]|uniref:Uncharacterized protein LOC112683778 n=1 Tax=Sipha flava TaxID=143950 RepID=A0A8B8FIJ5_9HEMI|nr:uncharacterized protein LOC112683778 [Sipha flava]
MRLEIKTIAARDAPENKSTLSSSTVTVTQHLVPLPKIQLPSFNGSLLKWRTFRDVCISLVHDNTGIGNAERFHYLFSCLSGSALDLIKTIPLSADNYAVAWDALSDRFDNKRLLASAHLDKLFAFKPIARESLPALIAFVNTFKEKVSIIKSLGVDDLSNFLLFYMGSRVLDSTTLSLFESNISHSNIPNFDELLSFVQHRCKILENLNNSSKLDREDKPSERANVRGKFSKSTKSVFTTTTSTSVKLRSKNCLCCDKPDHRIYQCPKFAGMTVDKRRETVLSQKLCFACMSPTHSVNACSSTKCYNLCNSKLHNTMVTQI